MTSIADGHLTDEQLLFYADGELTQGDSECARRHLEACWTCRAKFEDLQETIKKIVDFRERVLLPMVPAPPRPWDGLEPHMRELDGRLEKGSVADRLRSLWRLGALAPRYVVFVILVLAALAAVVWLPSQPAVSAHELLARVQAAQSAELGKVTAPVLHQKLRARRKIAGSAVQVSADYDSWEDHSRGRYRQTGSSAEILTELRTIYNANRLDWQSPLSAAGYARWRDSLAAKQDVIAPPKGSTETDPQNGFEPLTLITIPNRQAADRPDNPSSDQNRITKAELVVRTADWHPVKARLWVSDREYEIAELDYKVLPLSEVNALIFAEPPTHPEPASLPHPVMVEARTALVPPPSQDPEETEMAVRYGLHRIEADLGESIEISRLGQAKVMIDASAVAPELQARIEQEMASLPNTELKLDSIRDRDARTVPSQEPGGEPASRSVTSAPPTNPNQKRLEEILGGPQARESFTEEVLAISEDALSHGFALRNLATRYPVEEEEKLTPTAKAQLKEMVDDHISVLIQRTNRLKAFMWPLLEDLSNSRAPEDPSQVAQANGVRPDQPGDVPGTGARTGTTPNPSHHWQNTSIELLAQAQQVYRFIVGLLPGTNDPIPADQVVPGLRQALSDEQQALNDYQASVGLSGAKQE